MASTQLMDMPMKYGRQNANPKWISSIQLKFPEKNLNPCCCDQRKPIHLLRKKIYLNPVYGQMLT